MYCKGRVEGGGFKGRVGVEVENYFVAIICVSSSSFSGYVVVIERFDGERGSLKVHQQRIRQSLAKRKVRFHIMRSLGKS